MRNAPRRTLAPTKAAGASPSVPQRPRQAGVRQRRGGRAGGSPKMGTWRGAGVRRSPRPAPGGDKERARPLARTRSGGAPPSRRASGCPRRCRAWRSARPSSCSPRRRSTTSRRRSRAASSSSRAPRTPRRRPSAPRRSTSSVRRSDCWSCGCAARRRSGRCWRTGRTCWTARRAAGTGSTPSRATTATRRCSSASSRPSPG
mmetsp:Transcript_19352/g.42347  ORF Transcript_19352/g.42347 Transcript_19352/m.42347 type:complete len:202 (+) Transcript_19352:770-1375(+)